jgi:hypothetical protein
LGVTREPPLDSWTRTLNEPDALILLEGAEPGTAAADWLAWGDAELPQPSRPRRRETLKIVREQLLDWTPDDRVADTPLLRLFREGSPLCRRNLLYGRLLESSPWVHRALAALVHPALRAAEAALAPLDSDVIGHEAWLDFVAKNASLPPSAAKKTRSTLQKNLEALGVLESSGPARRVVRARRAEPDPVAFGALLARNLLRTGRTEAPEAWARAESVPAFLFCVSPDYAGEGVEAGVQAGLLRRGFLAGAPRIHLGEALTEGP